MKKRSKAIILIISLALITFIFSLTFTIHKQLNNESEVIYGNDINQLKEQYFLSGNWEFSDKTGQVRLIDINNNFKFVTSSEGTYILKFRDLNYQDDIRLSFNGLHGDCKIYINDDIIFEDNNVMFGFSVKFKAPSNFDLKIELKDTAEFKCGFTKAPVISSDKLIINQNIFFSCAFIFCLSSLFIIFIILLFNNIAIKFNKNDISLMLTLIFSILLLLCQVYYQMTSVSNNLNNLSKVCNYLIPFFGSLTLISLRITIENAFSKNKIFKISFTDMVLTIISFSLLIILFTFDYSDKFNVLLVHYAYNIIIVLSSILFVFINRKFRSTFMFDLIILISALCQTIIAILQYISMLNVIDFFILPFIVIVFGLIYIVMNHNNNVYETSSDVEMNSLKEKIRDTEFTFLNSQIQSHFIYNTLNSIQALIYISPERAASLIEEFSTYLRTRLEFNKMPVLINFNEELKHIQTYLNIERERFGERIRYNFDINVKNFMIPPLSIQPLVENCVKHGISKQIKGGTVTVRTTEDKFNVYIEVIDDGVGFNPDKLSEKQRVGTQNISHRLDLHLHASFKITSKPGNGTHYIVTINKKYLKKPE